MMSINTFIANGLFPKIILSICKMGHDAYHPDACICLVSKVSIKGKLSNAEIIVISINHLIIHLLLEILDIIIITPVTIINTKATCVPTIPKAILTRLWKKI